MAEYMIKVRRPTSQRFKFVTSKGGTTTLRIHAALFTDREDGTGEERARRWIEANALGNPGYQFKAVPR